MGLAMIERDMNETLVKLDRAESPSVWLRMTWRRIWK